jgi:thiol-disulfide isomerase/thioredoxin
MQKLNQNSSLNRYNSIGISSFTPANIDTFVDFFRNLNIETVNYFQAMNNISFTLNTMASVMYSEIAKLEKNIKELEIYIDNFSFISGEDDLFNGSFVETFSDDSNLYTNDNYIFESYDRNGQKFTLNQNAFVDTVSGTMKAGSSIDLIREAPKITEYKNNYSSHISSASDIDNLFSEMSQKGWNTTIKSPSILTSRIEDFSKDVNYDYSNINGANSSVLISFNKPHRMNTVRISPNMGSDFQLVQIILYSDTQTSQTSEVSNKTYVLSSPILIDSVKDISFDEKSVASIKLIFNQPKYKRVQISSSAAEMQAKSFNSYVNKIRNQRLEKHDKLQDLVYSFFLERNEIAYRNSNVKYIPSYYTYRYPCDETEPIYGALSEFLKDKKSFVEMDAANRFSSNDQVSMFVESIVAYVLGKKYRMNPSVYLSVKDSMNPLGLKDINNNSIVPVAGYQSQFNQTSRSEDQLVATSSALDVNKALYSIDNVGFYEYMFSIKNIKFGLVSNSSNSNNEIGSNLSQKTSVFISKRISTNGFINALKVKSNYYIPKSNNPTLDLKETASIEFSVSNKPSPLNESDWTPVLPNGEYRVLAELLFPSNGTGRCQLRFGCSYPSLSVYEDGILLDPSRVNYGESNSGRIFNILNFIPSKVYVASYSVDAQISNPNLIDFSTQSLQQFIVRTYSDADGIGEKLSTYGSENKVKLSFDPYIDHSKLSGYRYSSDIGTSRSDGGDSYRPVVVTLENGQNAINLTNYLANKNIKYSLPANFNNEVYFIQNGKNIIFNKPVKNCRVTYDYIPENLRYKVVIRNLSDRSETSAYVDNFVLKYQVKNTDNLSDRLLKVF